MRIESIELTNYGPFYGTHSFAFSSRGLVLIMGDNQDEPRMDSNGSGKSSIFDALDWCLFGKVPRGDHADSICNEESTFCSVRVNLADDTGVNSQIVRTRGKKNTLAFMEGTVDRTALDTKETQAHIERYLGLDRDVFHAAVLFGQTDLVHYADSTDAERMEILTKILQLDEIDILLDKAKAQVALVDSKAARLNVDIKAQTAVLENLKRTDLTSSIRAWDERRDVELTRLRNMLATFEAAVKTPLADVGDVPSLKSQLVALETAQRNLSNPSADGVNSLVTQANQIDRLRDNAQYQLNQLQQQAMQFRGTLAAEKQVCASCGQVVSREHIEVKLAGVERDIITQTATVATLTAQSDTLRLEIGKQRAEYDKALLGIQESRNDYTRQITELRGKLKLIESQIAQVQKAIDDINNLKILIAAKEGESNPFILQAKENIKNIEQIKSQIALLEVDVSKVSLEQQYLNFWVTGLGVKGLKSYILDSRLQELTDAANQWVKILTGGTIWVQFESQKQTRGNKLVNSPDIRVCRWNPDGSVSERNYKSWSGGEKQRISFAIDFGLSRLIASRAKQSYDILILDEVFRHLDRSGKEAVMEMLQLLTAEKSSVLVVEHDTEFQDAFEHRICVRKRNRRSSILEVVNGNETNQATDARNGSVQTRVIESKGPLRTPVIRTPAN